MSVNRCLLVVAGLLLVGAGAHADVAVRTSKDVADPWGDPVVVLKVGLGHHPTKYRLQFALYRSGRVLYAEAEFSDRYRLITLTPSEQKALIGDLPLDRVGNLHPPDLWGFDGATECIVTWRGGREQQDCLWGGIEMTNGNAPPDMVRIWKRLAHYIARRARPWVSERVKVTLSPWGSAGSCAPRAAIPWPPGWPRPTGDDPKDAHSIFTLPRSRVPELARLSNTYGPDGCRKALYTDGKPYFLYYETAFPHEDLWLAERR